MPTPKLSVRIPYTRSTSSESVLARPLVADPDAVPLEDVVLGTPAARKRQSTLSQNSLFSDSRNPWVRGLQNACIRGAMSAGNGYRAVKPYGKTIGVTVALSGLTVWCVTLTVLYAKQKKEIDALWDLPFCDTLGLVPALPQFVIEQTGPH